MVLPRLNAQRPRRREAPALTVETPQHLCLDKGYDYEAVRVMLDA
jgi:hypothetical protein